MQKKIYNLLIISLLGASAIFSCTKKTDPSTQTCNIATIANAKGKTFETFTFDAANHLIKDVSDTAGTTYIFTYNSQNLVSNIDGALVGSSGTTNFSVAFTYDASGLATKSVVTIQGTIILTNTYVYTAGKVTKVVSTDGTSVQTTRFEYSGDNISKVFLQTDNGAETLYYAATKYDTNKTIFPSSLRSLTMGLTVYFDYFSYFNANNPLSETYYNTDGTIAGTIDYTLEYESHSLPSKLTAVQTVSGTKSTGLETYQYTCK